MATQVILNPVGSGGDVFPFLPIGMELQKRGHHVALMTNPCFQENAGHANVEFIGMGSRESIQELAQNKTEPAWKTALRWGCIKNLQQSFDVIENRVRRCPTIILSSPLALGARIAASRFDVPLVSLIPSPYVIRSEYDSPVTKPMFLQQWMPRLFKRIQYWFADKFFIDPIIRGEVNALRAKQNMAPTQRIFHRWFLSPDLIIGLFPSFFAEPQKDWPQQMRLTGAVVWDPPISESERLRVCRFLGGAKAMVVLGGSMGIGGQDFYRNLILASRELQQKLLILDSNPNVLPKSLPNYVMHAKYYPIGDILDGGRIILHTGSIGATLRSLHAGSPQIVIPSVNDQFDNANRICRLNCGRVGADNLSSQNMVKMIRQLESDEKLQNDVKQQVGHIDSERSVNVTCDLIEDVFEKKGKS